MGLPFSTFRRRGRKLRPMSDKTRALWPAREACVRAVLKRDGYRCRANLEGCEGKAIDAHEPNPRSRGGDPTDPDQCIAVCRRCHNKIHRNPALAVGLGLTVSQKH